MGSHLIPSSLVVWKDVSERALSDLNRTITQAWTDLDLTVYTSANAKVAILRIICHIDSYTSGTVYMGIRKNGTTPASYPTVRGIENPIANDMNDFVTFVGLDAGQVIEYILAISLTAQADFYIDVLGYIE